MSSTQHDRGAPQRRHQDRKGRYPRPGADRPRRRARPAGRARVALEVLDGANSAGELYGRALVVISAEQHAGRLVLPAGQRMPATHSSSHKDLATKALRKLAAGTSPRR